MADNLTQPLLIVNTKAQVAGQIAPSMSQSDTASYAASQTLNQTLVLRAGQSYSPNIGFSNLVISTTGPVQLVAAVGANPAAINQTVTQQTTIDSAVDSFTVTNNGTTSVTVKMTIVVTPNTAIPPVGVVTSVNGLIGNINVVGGPGISVTSGAQAITVNNTGVLSINGQTGNVNLTASNISYGSGTVAAALDTLTSQINQARTITTVVCTSAGQLVYPIPGGYPVGHIDVYAMGAHQINGFDYSATDGLNLTLTPATAAWIPVGAHITLESLSSFSVADAVTLAQLGGTSGATLVGYGSTTVAQALTALQGTVATAANYAALRAYTGNALAVNLVGIPGTTEPQGIVGTFLLDTSGSPATDNNATIIIDSSSRVWRRQLDGINYKPEWFGAVADGVTDDLASFQLLANYLGTVGGGVISLNPSKTYFLSQYTPAQVPNILGQTTVANSKILWLPSNVTVDGKGGATILFSGGSSSPLGYGTSANIIVAPLTENVTNVTSVVTTVPTSAVVASVTGLSVGQQVSLARQGGNTGGIPNTPSQERAPNQFVTIQSINSGTSTLTFNESFIHDFAAVQNLQVNSVASGAAYPTNVWFKDLTIQSSGTNIAYLLMSRATHSGFAGEVNFIYANWSFGTCQDMSYDVVYNRVGSGSGSPTIESTNIVNGRILRSECIQTGGPSLGGLFVNDTSKAVNLDEVVCTGFDRSGVTLLYGCRVNIRRMELDNCAYGPLVDALYTYYAALSVGFPPVGTYGTPAVAASPAYLVRNCGNGEVFIGELRITGPAVAPIKTADANLTIDKAYIEFSNSVGNSAPILFGQTGFHRADTTYYPRGGQGQLRIRDLTVKTLLGPNYVCSPLYGYSGLFADAAAHITAAVTVPTATSVTVDFPQNIKPTVGFLFIGNSNTGVIPNNIGITSIVGNTINLSAAIGDTLNSGAAIWQPVPNPRVSQNVFIQRVNLDGVEVTSWNGDSACYPVVSSASPEIATAAIAVPGSGCWTLYYRIMNNSGTSVSEAIYSVVYDATNSINAVAQVSQGTGGAPTPISLGAPSMAAGVVSIPITYAVSGGSTLRSIFRFVPNGSLQLAII